MQWFFWAIVVAYIFLYFFAAYLYDGFSFPMAIGLFGLIGFGVYWQRRKNKVVPDEPQPAPVNHAPAEPLSIWQSPIPYMGVLAVCVLVGFIVFT